MNEHKLKEKMIGKWRKWRDNKWRENKRRKYLIDK